MDALSAALSNDGRVDGKNEGNRGEEGEDATDPGREVQEVDRDNGDTPERHEQEARSRGRAGLGRAESQRETGFIYFSF